MGMEVYFNLFVKVATLAYVLLKLWLFLVRNKGYGVWDRLLPDVRKREAPEQEPEPATAPIPDKGIMGKTHTTYLKKEVPSVPGMSQGLEPSDFIGEEADISPDEVEADLSGGTGPMQPDEEERFFPLEERGDTGMNEFSSGMTYDELSNAVGVVSGGESGDDNRIRAARTLYEVRQTDLFQFFTTQVTNVETVDRLFEECLDGNGSPLKRPQRRREFDPVEGFDPLEGFDMDKFV